MPKPQQLHQDHLDLNSLYSWQKSIDPGRQTRPRKGVWTWCAPCLSVHPVPLWDPVQPSAPFTLSCPSPFSPALASDLPAPEGLLATGSARGKALVFPLVRQLSALLRSTLWSFCNSTHWWNTCPASAVFSSDWAVNLKNSGRTFGRELH